MAATDTTDTTITAKSPMLAFATYTTPKQPYAPPMLAFVTYTDNVEPDTVYTETQLKDFKAVLNPDGDTVGIRLSWNLNGLDHAIIRIKKAPLEGNNATDWKTAEIVQEAEGDLHTTTFLYPNATTGYKYYIEGIGVDADGNQSNPDNIPWLECLVSVEKYNPDADVPTTPSEGAISVITPKRLKQFYKGIKDVFVTKAAVNKTVQQINTKIDTKVDLSTNKHIKLPNGTEIWVE